MYRVYEQVLAMVPEHAQAAHNHAIVANALAGQPAMADPDRNDDEGGPEAPAVDEASPRNDPATTRPIARAAGGEQQRSARTASDDVGRLPSSAEHYQGAYAAPENPAEAPSVLALPGQAHEPVERPSGDAYVQAVLVPVPEVISAEEKNQMMEQWLREVPDDPIGLLRNKLKLRHLRAVQVPEIEAPAIRAWNVAGIEPPVPGSPW